jgi:hypothetical protein
LISGKDDPYHIEREDQTGFYEEARYHAIGMVENLLLFVAFTYRQDNIRLISARHSLTANVRGSACLVVSDLSSPIVAYERRQAMLPSLLARDIQQGIKQFLITSFEPADGFFYGVIRRFVDNEPAWMKGPYLQVGLPPVW